ncbi:S8/S53 family peptidase [Myxococcota bacterium]|nr:S8/S53 family peptidase [Myxococcota bacterium]MBU1410579.1 S8/S53 family peptidase [Myxococcota bacterium]MBU1512310.1 S8/S53 family peptidase [Myxococcota bacterium]
MRVREFFSSLWLLLFLLSSGCGTNTQKNNSDDYVPSHDMYLGDSDPERVVSREVEGVLEEFPDDQVLVVFKEDAASQENLSALAQTIDGTLIGEIPDIQLAQYRITPRAPEQIDALLDQLRALPQVEGAMPNLLIGVNESPDECRARGDSDLYLEQNPFAEERCALELTDFFNTVPLVRKLKELGLVHPIRLAIVDIDFAGLTSPFKNLQWNLLDPSSPATLEDRVSNHGFMVSGILAADEDGIGTGGILPATLGSDMLQVFIGPLHTTSEDHRKATFAAGINMMIRAARDAKVHIINFSSGEALAPNSSNTKEIIKAYKMMMLRYPNTLFVCSGGNDGQLLTGDNHAPGGMLDIPNLVTTAGTLACDPTTPHRLSNYGEDSVTVSASYQFGVLKVEAPEGPVDLDSGNSLSAPVVAGLAAIVKSLAPNLSPWQIKQYLILNGNLHDENLGPYIQFSRTVLDVLRETQSSNMEVMDLIQRDDQDVDLLAIILDRLCGNFELSVEGLRSWWLEPDSEEGQGCTVIGMGANSLTITMNEEEADSMMSFTAQLYELLQLKTDYSFSQSNVGFYYRPNSDEQYNGLSSEGSLVFSSCLITQRNGNNYLPLAIELEGTLSGTLRLQHLPSADEADYPISSVFRLACPVMVIDNLDPMVRALETQCHNGNLR